MVQIQRTDGSIQRLDGLDQATAAAHLKQAARICILDADGSLTYDVQNKGWRKNGQDADEADLPAVFACGALKLRRPEGGQEWQLQ